MHAFRPAGVGTARGVGRRLSAAVSALGPRQSDATIVADARSYWQDGGTPRWLADSHWRDAEIFGENDTWDRIGRRHLHMYERAARTFELEHPWGRIVEWGCGGGANAVCFAPRAGEFVGVDVVRASLDECGRQVAAVCDTPWRPVLVDVDAPEQAIDEVGPCDAWLSFYVFELIPGPRYGERLLRTAWRMLRPGGIALVQVKYRDERWNTRPRRRSYRRAVAAMTTYRIEEFWLLAERCGFVPRSVELVPRDELDERYAYFLLSRP